MAVKAVGHGMGADHWRLLQRDNEHPQTRFHKTEPVAVVFWRCCADINLNITRILDEEFSGAHLHECAPIEHITSIGAALNLKQKIRSRNLLLDVSELRRTHIVGRIHSRIGRSDDGHDVQTIFVVHLGVPYVMVPSICVSQLQILKWSDDYRTRPLPYSKDREEFRDESVRTSIGIHLTDERDKNCEIHASEKAQNVRVDTTLSSPVFDDSEGFTEGLHVGDQGEYSFSHSRAIHAADALVVHAPTNSAHAEC